MKYIQKFENFNNDGSRDDGQSFPSYNPAINLKAQQYVDRIFSKGSGAEVFELCKEIGCETPKEDDELETLKETAIRYFIENPERMKEVEDGFKQYPYGGGDRVVRTNNVGGTSFTNSPRIGESSHVEEEWVKLSITDDEMRLFSTESPLQDLIRKNKIELHDNEVWFKNADKSTKEVLDVYLEIDDEV